MQKGRITEEDDARIVPHLNRVAAGLAEAVKEYTEQGVEEDWMAFLLRTRPTFMDGKDAFEKEYLGKMSPSRHIEQIETSQMAISRKLNGTVKNLQIGETTFLEEALRGYWLSSFERDFEGDTVVYFFNHPELKKAALEKLKKPDSEGLFKTLLYAALHSDNNFELAVALQMIAQHCEENSDPRRLWKAIRALQEANPEDASKLFLLFSFFKDARVQMLRVLEAAKGEDNAFEIQVHKDEAKLTLKGDWRFFDPDVLDHFHQNLLSTDASSGAVGREVEAITMEGIPAAEKLWQEIRERRSITLGETQEIDLRDVLPSSWHIFISPKTGMEAYSLTIRVVKQINGKVKHVEIKGKLDHSGFKSGVVLPTELAAKIHSVGSLAAHRYFVREMEKEVGARVKERKATITGEDADGKKEEEVAVPLKGARIGNDTLTIDLTEKDKTADRERQARTQARIGRSNQVLRKHLNKLDLSDEELEELMLFIPSESPVRGKKVYDLITDLERKKEFLKEGLEGKNLWVMVVSPHSKAAGFQVHRPGTTLKELPPSALFEEDKPTMELSVYAIERREATDHSMWAYLTYEKNGFEPMGDKELEPYDSLVGIKVEARPELVTLMSKIDRLNPEWPKNLFAQKGLIWSVDPEEKIDETDSLEKKNYAAMGRNFISPEGIATLFLGNQPSNRLFNQGSFIPVERFISDLHFAPNRDTIV